MKIIFVRHGERRAGETDPALTSFGFRMVEETAEWIRELGIVPRLAQATPTRRTQQTATTILAHFPETSLELIAEASENQTDWELWADGLSQRETAPDCVLIVGHHPTLEMLLQSYGPPPVVVSRHHFAVGLLLEHSGSRWTISCAWPGRRS